MKRLTWQSGAGMWWAWSGKHRRIDGEWNIVVGDDGLFSVDFTAFGCSLIESTGFKTFAGAVRFCEEREASASMVEMVREFMIEEGLP